MKLQEKLDALKKESMSNRPPEIVATLLQETKNLVRSGLADKAIDIGETMPEFTLSDEKGNYISSKTLLAKGPLAISFYRGVWWPYCNVELEALQEVYGQVQELGGSIIAISPQLRKYTKQVVKKHNLTFPVLNDKDNGIAGKFGLTFTLTKKLQDVYSSFGIDLQRFNGNDAWELPMSGRFIVDRNGIIKSTDVHPDHTIRPEPCEIVDIMKSLSLPKHRWIRQFCTMMLLIIDINKKCVYWSRPGHEPLIYCNPDTDDFVELKDEGIALGFVKKAALAWR